MKRLKNLLFSPFLADYKLLLALSVPALLLGAFGLYQLGVKAVPSVLAAETAKLVCEFLFLGALLSLARLLGIKNKWLLAALAFVYYLTITADLVLLWYFKERFGAKYLNTMEGGDYKFLTDWRVLSYFILLGAFCFFAVRRWYRTSDKKTALHRLAVCLAGLGLLYAFNPLQLLPAPDNFYASYLMPPSVVYTANAVLAPAPKALLTDNKDAGREPLAEKYNVFNAQNTGVGRDYKRVILIATEAFSNKYIHTFNPKIPVQASRTFDKLFKQYPAVPLKHVTLSTLYGLSVIFTSHPFVELAYTHQYPTSAVRILKDRGFKTVFLRGANEKYMDEDVLFKQAGFEEVTGRTYFETRPDYEPFIHWWGLTDRKLFEYAAEYLTAHKNEPVFMTLLTVDTHVPLGRPEYPGQEYEEIDHEFYDIPTQARAFARYGQDLKRFLTDLDKKGLFDDDTLVLITGDHPAYPDTPANALFSPHPPLYDDLPFIILTRQKITRPLTTNPLASQLDIAPTLLDLLNIPQPRGFFGHSLFDAHARRTVFDVKEDYAVVTTDTEKHVIPFTSSRPEDKRLIRLMTTFLTD